MPSAFRLDIGPARVVQLVLQPAQTGTTPYEAAAGSAPGYDAPAAGDAFSSGDYARSSGRGAASCGSSGWSVFACSIPLRIAPLEGARTQQQ